MRLKVLNYFGMLLAVVLFSYGAAQGQVVNAIKDAAKKTKDVTVDAAKKTKDVTVDIADKTKDVTVDVAKKTAEVTTNIAGGTADVATDVWDASAKGTKKAVYYTGDKTADFAKLGYDGGKEVVVTTWDGTKWVSKKTWVFTKKAADGTKDFIVGDGEVKP